MARLFNGSSDVIVTSSVPTTNQTLISMSVWVWQVANSGTQIVMYNGNTNSNGWGFYSNASNLFFLLGGTSQNAYTLSSPGVWTHLVAVNTSAGSPNWIIYLSGVAQAAFNPSALVIPTGSLSFGANGGSNFNNCRLADGAIWNVALTDGEAAALAAGARPGSIRPQSLAGWWPLDGLASTEPDYSGNTNNGTLTGTSFAPGPPVMMFTPRWPQFLASAAAAPAPSFGWFGGFPGPQPLFVPPGIRQQSPAMTMQPPTTVTTIIPVFNPGFPNIFRRDKSVN